MVAAPPRRLDADDADVGFQVELGLPGVRSVPPPEGGEKARLDTKGISPQKSDCAYLDGAENGDQLSLPLGDLETRKERRLFHAGLTGMLRGLESGGHGLVAKAIGIKWADKVSRCPGVVRRHQVCGQPSFCPSSCDFPLCPWCQHRRSAKARANLAAVVDLLAEPKLVTLNPPNVADLSPGAVSAMGKVFTLLSRRAVLKEARGGVRSIETTHGRNGWNLHLHALVDMPWLAQYPVWDIRRVGDSWKVTKKHPGLAREFTEICQKFPELKSPRLDFDLDNPSHWYFVDVRQADKFGAVAEVVKYIAKGVQLVEAGPRAVVDFLLAIKGRRMIQTFGSLYNVEIEPESGDWEGVDPAVRGECPYEDCPAPHVHEWEFVTFGPADFELERDSRTGSYRITGVLRGPPE